MKSKIRKAGWYNHWTEIKGGEYLKNLMPDNPKEVETQADNARDRHEEENKEGFDG